MNFEAWVGIILIAIGLFIVARGDEETRPISLYLGILLTCVGMMVSIFSILPIENYTECENQIIVEIEDGQYLIETDDKYIYRPITYSYSGENIPPYKVIKKDTNVSVEIIKDTLSNEPYMVIFIRYAKNIFGIIIQKQTEYVFFIP